MNGDAGEHSSTESQHAVGDASGGSDTDISRPGSVDQAKRPAGHLRTNSVKKPASFKSVSVTKNFLAKSAVSTPAARPGDKTATAGQTPTATLQTARPRLVAKSGGSNVPRSLGKLNGAGSGPDASKVWNKNQPVPPPPPKQFTDEELKQQYGIHLATRLQADESGKEAKWADIDDDEDDWAPETVQWMDGTKSTVAAVENEAPPPEEATPAPMETPPAAPKPTSSPPANTQKSTLTGGPKTILKPGAHAQAIASKPKGQPEKPTLVAKPSPAAPVKSPWATLPPVDKVSPIQINPPAQQPLRFSRDNMGYDSMPPPLAPAKEIAPDDFNRTWRDERGNRELFNSQSGRYEPVGEMRRGSMRDSSFRQQPSVLQRPPHDGPAEPSAAFQTSRTTEGPTWGRRRNSSNVSGGSGRRMSFDRRGPDLPPMSMNLQRRESQSINGGDTRAPGTPRHSLPPKPMVLEQQSSSLPPRSSPAMSQAQPASPFESVGSQDAGTPGEPPQIQNLVEVQQRLLHGDLDSVKLRKQQEKEREAREEAERKERLRKKMEALGFSGEANVKTKEPSPSRPGQKSPHKEKALPSPVQSPPKPPMPTSEGEVAQYGMMKVHQPQPVKKSYPSDTTLQKTTAPKPSSDAFDAQGDVQTKPSPSLTASAQPSNDLTRDSESAKSQTEPQIQAQQSKVAGTQGTKPSQPPQAPWSSSSLPQQPRSWTSSVWGPPQAKDRALGNGTFSQQVPSQSQPGPAQIGLNSSLKPSSSQPQATSSQPFAQQGMYSQTAGAPIQASTASKPGPIAPPADKGWGNFHAHIRRDDQDVMAKAKQNLERLGGDTFRPEIRETYTDQKGKSQTTLHSKVGGVEAKTSQPPPTPDLKVKDESSKTTQDGPSPVHSIGQGVTPQPTTQGARSSRFFPRTAETTTQVSSTSSKHDSPPPPETESHPAFTGDTSHPVVKMPKPSPRVRLPPAAVEAAVQADAPVSMPPRTRVGLGARPLALTQEWQARFNSLLDKPSQPASTPAPIARPQPSTAAVTSTKPGALAVAASSKAPLDDRGNTASATVSLPVSANKRTFADDNSSDVTTRIGVEVLLEDREFGSLPTVKLSKIPHLAADEPSVGFPPTPRQNSRINRPLLDIFTKPMWDGDLNKHADEIKVAIRLGKLQEAIVKSIPRKRKSGKGPGHPRPKKTFTNGTNSSPTNGQSPRPRKPSNFQGQGSSSNSSPRGSTGNGWSNNRSTPPHNSNPWNRRATPAAPVH